MVLVEELLKASGNFGPAQWLMLSLFCLVNVLSAFHYFAQTFITLGTGSACDNSTENTETSQFHTLTSEVSG